MMTRQHFTLCAQTLEYINRESKETGLRKSTIVRQALKARQKKQEEELKNKIR